MTARPAEQRGDFISYKSIRQWSQNAPVAVYLGKGKIGTIFRAVQGGWYYKPVSSTSRGQIFPTIEEVKRSLEAQ